MAIDVWADTVQTVAVVLGAGAAFVAWRQVRISRHGGGQANALALWGFLTEEQTRLRRKQVMDALDRAGPFNVDDTNWTDDEYQAAIHVASNWSMAAALARRDAIPADLLKEEWGQAAIRYWAATEAVVRFERIRRRDPQLWANFEWFADYASR